MICRTCVGDKIENEFYPSELRRPGGRRPRCVVCVKAARSPELARKSARAWYERNRETQAAKFKENYKRDREKILLQKKVYYRKQEALGIKRRATPEQARRVSLKMNYGLTPEAYAELLSTQGGCCAICKHPPKRKMLSVDHNHTTGQVRGLLCSQCNFAVGFLESGPDIKAVRGYIEHHEALRQREQIHVVNEKPHLLGD